MFQLLFYSFVDINKFNPSIRLQSWHYMLSISHTMKLMPSHLQIIMQPVGGRLGPRSALICSQLTLPRFLMGPKRDSTNLFHAHPALQHENLGEILKEKLFRNPLYVN